MSSLPKTLQSLLKKYSQTHLTQFWSQLSEAEQDKLRFQIEVTDFDLLQSIWKKSHSASESNASSSAERVQRAAAPASVFRQPTTAKESAVWQSAVEAGEAELSAAKVAVVTVAGGQGTRLGFDHPKGMFPIGPVSNRSLFQIFAEQILARRRRHHARLFWMIMTSDATHDETVRFFEENDYFSLPSDTVQFFMQGSLPALDAATGKILLNGPAELALSPDGHGGLIMALKNSGLLDRLEEDGVEHVFYHQVDNPTVIIADPALIGFHAQQKSQLTTNVVCKTSPTERMGVLVDVGGQTEIIEYSELTPEQAAGKDASGQWIFWAGNTAIHVFDRRFLQKLAEDGCRLPLHVARKNVPFIDDKGELIQPDDATKPNAIKFERFIFDALPLAEKTLIVEGNREREFNPVKNKSGADSADTSRAALNRIGREWLQMAGVTVSEDQSIEIRPLDALDAQELTTKLADGTLTVAKLTSPQ
jgi:UDP-N-acetylglucosamine/UDP-N-acetylgalactosamine diphosphorylase